MQDVQMSNRELDAAIARNIMQWQTVGLVYPDLRIDCIGRNAQGHTDVVPRYSTDCNACAEMEAELARLNKTVKYLGCLCDITGANFELYAYNTAFEENLWLIATATPRQRCEAAYLALEGTHDA